MMKPRAKDAKIKQPKRSQYGEPNMPPMAAKPKKITEATGMMALKPVKPLPLKK
jgi:hypothetical protein